MGCLLSLLVLAWFTTYVLTAAAEKTAAHSPAANGRVDSADAEAEADAIAVLDGRRRAPRLRTLRRTIRFRAPVSVSANGTPEFPSVKARSLLGRRTDSSTCGRGESVAKKRQVHVLLGNAEERLGNTQKAMAEYKPALSMAREFRPAQQALERVSR